MNNQNLGTALRRSQCRQVALKSKTRLMLTTGLATAIALASASASFASGLNNTANATGTPAAGTLVPPTSSLSIPVQPKSPSYTVVKSVVSMTTTNGAAPSLTDGGDIITYSYVVANTGNVSLNTIAVSDAGPTFNGGANNALTSGPTYAAGDTNTNSVLDVGETWTYTATYLLTQGNVDVAAGVAGGVSNTVAVTAKDPQNVAVVPTPGGSTLTATTTIPASPSLQIAKTANTAGPLTVGQVVNYSFLVTNNGNVTVSGISVNETAFNGSGTAPVPVGGLSSLAPGGTTTWTASYTVTQADIDNLQ